MNNAGMALSRDKILDNVWRYDYYGDARTVDTHIKKLRGKLGEYGDHIRTIRGSDTNSKHRKGCLWKRNSARACTRSCGRSRLRWCCASCSSSCSTGCSTISSSSPFIPSRKSRASREAYVQADRLIQDDDEAFRRAMDDLAQTSNMFTLIWNTRRMIYDFQNRTAGFIQVPYFDMSPGTYQVVEEEKSLSIPEDYLQSRSIKLYGRLHSGSISSSRPPRGRD